MDGLDRIDLEIIGQLQNNARITNKALAKQVGLAASSCLMRVQSLLGRKLITGFHAEINPHQLGAKLQAIISINIERHSEKTVEKFLTYLLELTQSHQVYHLAGPVDFMIHVWVRDSDELRAFVMGSLASRKEVKHINTELIYSHQRASSQSFSGYLDEVD